MEVGTIGKRICETREQMAKGVIDGESKGEGCAEVMHIR